MKAVIFKQYGPPELLTLEDTATPVPGDNEVLVKIQAASVNSWDWELLHGIPFANRLGFGLFKPRIRSLGADMAGKVEAVGKGVTRFKPGDAVYGDLSSDGWCCFAEYVCAPEHALRLKPANISFEQAAAVPQAGLLALQSLRDKGRIQAGQKVLINGAGGGAGSFALQIARHYQAEVTGVDSSGKLDTMRSLGTDHIMDYTRKDFTRTGQRYDLVVDMALQRSLRDCLRVLKPGGRYIVVGGASGKIFQVLFLGPVLSLITGKHIRLLIHKANRGLDAMGKLLEAGTIRSEIDRIYKLEETPDALAYFGSGKVRGKLIIKIADSRRELE